MKMIAGFRGKNREFRAWLRAGMPANNVVSLEGHKMKKAAREAAIGKPFRPSIA